MAEDEDFEQDSDEYRKWRQGDDNDKYASSRTPTQTGSSSGEYNIPQTTDTPTVSQGDDGTEKIFWENGTTIDTNYTVGTSFGAACNAMSAGPITINAVVTITGNMVVV